MTEEKPCKSKCPLDGKPCKRPANIPYHDCGKHPGLGGHAWFQFTKEAPF